MKDSETIKVSWIPLQKYFEEWLFLGSNEAYRIAEQIGSIDYLIDIKNRLPDYKLIKKCHDRVILISLGALFEFGLKRVAQIRLEKEKASPNISKTLNTDKEEKRLREEGMEATINRMHDAELLDEGWCDFLHKVRVLRDEVHLDRNRDENIQKWVEEIGPSGIQDKINSFKEVLTKITCT